MKVIQPQLSFRCRILLPKATLMVAVITVASGTNGLLNILAHSLTTIPFINEIPGTTLISLLLCHLSNHLDGIRVAFPFFMIKLRIVWCSFGAVAVTKHGLHRHLGRSFPLIEAFYGEKTTG